MAPTPALAYTAPVPNPGACVSRIELPAPILFAWMVLTLVLMGQGLRLASERQQGFEPSRPATLETGVRLDVAAGTGDVAYLDPPTDRLAIYQELPERRLLRWIETEAPRSTVLLIPLEGLDPGDYLVCTAPGASAARAREMDRPTEALDVRARFRILPP